MSYSSIIYSRRWSTESAASTALIFSCNVISRSKKKKEKLVLVTYTFLHSYAGNRTSYVRLKFQKLDILRSYFRLWECLLSTTSEWKYTCDALVIRRGIYPQLVTWKREIISLRYSASRATKFATRDLSLPLPIREYTISKLERPH